MRKIDTLIEKLRAMTKNDKAKRSEIAVRDYNAYYRYDQISKNLRFSIDAV